MTVHVTITHGVADGSVPIAQRTLAAMQTRTDPQVDYFEKMGPADVAGSIMAGLGTAVCATTVLNVKILNPAATKQAYKMPYRGSQVLIAYDSAKVTNPPKTFADIMAWAKANPGRFCYGRPEKGGSRSHFVIRAIHGANGMDPSLFTISTFEPAKAEDMMQDGRAIAKELHPFTEFRVRLMTAQAIPFQTDRSAVHVLRKAVAGLCHGAANLDAGPQVPSARSRWV